jgi:hypothetical protein
MNRTQRVQKAQSPSKMRRGVGSTIDGELIAQLCHQLGADPQRLNLEGSELHRYDSITDRN